MSGLGLKLITNNIPKNELQIVGYATNRQTTVSSGYILTLDTNGNKISERYETIPNKNLVFKCAVSTTDGGFVVAGYYTQDDQAANDMVVIKYDPQGVEEWFYQTGSLKNEVGYMVRQTSDGGFVVSGDAEESNGLSYDMFMVKLTANGEQEWSYRYEDVYNTGNQSMIICADGNYLLCGEGSTQGSNFFDLVFVKVNPEGDLIWAKTFGKEGTEAAFSLLEEGNGDIMLTGYTSSQNSEVTYNVFLGKMDPKGESVKIKYFEEKDISIGYELIKAVDGGYLIAATSGAFFNVIRSTDGDYEDTFTTTSSTVGLGELVSPSRALCYPNPASNGIRYEGHFPVKIVNATGQVLGIYLNGPDLDISFLQPGCYTLVPFSGVARRFIKL